MLRDVGASRVAFYHYFGSKQSLLEAVYEAGMTMGCSHNRTLIAEFGKGQGASEYTAATWCDWTTTLRGAGIRVSSA